MRKLLFILVGALGWMSFTLLPEGKDLPKLEVSANKHYLKSSKKFYLTTKDAQRTQTNTIENVIVVTFVTYL